MSDQLQYATSPNRDFYYGKLGESESICRSIHARFFDFFFICFIVCFLFSANTQARLHRLWLYPTDFCPANNLPLKIIFFSTKILNLDNRLKNIYLGFFYS